MTMFVLFKRYPHRRPRQLHKRVVFEFLTENRLKRDQEKPIIVIPIFFCNWKLMIQQLKVGRTYREYIEKRFLKVRFASQCFYSSSDKLISPTGRHGNWPNVNSSNNSDSGIYKFLLSFYFIPIFLIIYFKSPKSPSICTTWHSSYQIQNYFPFCLVYCFKMT